MAKKIENKATTDTAVNEAKTDKVNKLETREIELSNGVKVTVNEPTTPQVRKSRDLASTPTEPYLYLLSDCCLFDGKMYTPPEIDSLRSCDYLSIEGCIRELLGEKN